MGISQELQEEAVDVSGLRVSYKIAGQGPALLLLHGWGASSDSWVKVMSFLSEQGYQTICPDLPGFGKTAPPPVAWGVTEYTKFVQELAGKLGLSNMVLLGHSFGGQLSVAFTIANPEIVRKLILVAPAAIRRRPGFGKRAMRIAAKILGAFLFLVPVESLRANIRKGLYKLLGRSDYRKATGVMREIMVQVIEQDLSPFFSEIRTETLLVWGEKDSLVPLADGKELQKGIPGSRLVILAGRNHAPNLEAPEELSRTILTFLKQS